MTSNIILTVVLIAIIYILISLSKKKGNSREENLKKGEKFLAANAVKPGVVTTESGLQYEILDEGYENGRSPLPFHQVRCHYKGTFIDGKVFDSSYGGDPIVFPLSGVIRGWTEGLQYMREGAKFRFVIPYDLAYGRNGCPPIPPCSTLIFEVELIEVL